MRRLWLVVAALLTLAGIVILIGLGVWQLERKEWKENLLATVSSRAEREPGPLPPRAEWPRIAQETSEYSRVAFSASFLEGEEAYAYTSGSSLRADVEGQGFWVFAPARLSGGSIVLINRGFVPKDRKDLSTRAEGTPKGSIDIAGYLRWPEQRNMFTPADEPQNNVWYARDPASMAAAHKWTLAAPFYIDMEAPVPQGGLPKPGKIQVTLPNNHLQYAVTWFGLALALAGVYLAWFIARRRRHGGSATPNNIELI